MLRFYSLLVFPWADNKLRVTSLKQLYSSTDLTHIFLVGSVVELPTLI